MRVAMTTRYDCFQGKLAAVVGGAAGIGRACALMLAEQGARVVVVDIKDEGMAELPKAVGERGGSVRYVRADATRHDGVVRAAEAIESEGALRVLINAMGGYPTSRSSLEMTPEEWDAGIRVNLYSIFYSCSEMARLMVRHGQGGTIVNIASRSARVYSPAAPACYSDAKAAIEGLTRTLSGELCRYGIRINVVEPGTTITDRIKKLYTAEQIAQMGNSTARGKLADPKDIAAAVLFLASSDSIHIAGTALYVAAGQAGMYL
jgi:NAD(P)-dependent dehydrogenase (short-subunit alcohol dehydrogenase family)